MAPAIAPVDGIPHLELIFLHSESADGCNARRVPAASVSSDLKIASNKCRLHKQIDPQHAARPSCQHYFDAPNDSGCRKRTHSNRSIGSFSHYGRGWKLMHRQGHRRFNRGDVVLDRLLHLFEGTRFNLAHALA